ncbi:MAG: AMP-binding protein, partial [Candidatus Omnitrophica bacterium]|nr:AMP-binding protein [Candidatus Omnitrophota bacterium]
MSLSLASIVTETARRLPDQTALIMDETRYTYRQLRELMLSTAAYLQGLGVDRGTRLALMCPNRPEFTISYYGALAAGATVVTLNNLLVADEIVYQVENSDSVGVICDLDSYPQVRDAVQRTGCCKWILIAALDCEEARRADPSRPSLGEAIRANAPLESYAQTRPDDTAVVMYTSGTTGRPKGAELTHFNLWENARIVSERTFGEREDEILPLGPGHVAVAVLPLFHSFGQTCVQNALLFNGGAITYLPRFDAIKLADIIERDKVTILDAVPTIYNALISSEEIPPEKLRTLSFGISGGAALPIEVRKAFEERYRMPILEGYGLTETSPVACAQARWRPIKTGSIGQPVPGVEMRIFDDNDRELPPGVEGEVVIRGRNIMKGYLNYPEATEQVMRSGWFHSGDIGKTDEDGDFYIVDRKKDMIIRGGFNVYPREVE